MIAFLSEEYFPHNSSMAAAVYGGYSITNTLTQKHNEFQVVRSVAWLGSAPYVLYGLGI